MNTIKTKNISEAINKSDFSNYNSHVCHDIIDVYILLTGYVVF